MSQVSGEYWQRVIKINARFGHHSQGMHTEGMP
jgi:hypothetical protein